jgi:thiol-disulfide isomerase/thioredoxin
MVPFVRVPAGPFVALLVAVALAGCAPGGEPAATPATTATAPATTSATAAPPTTISAVAVAETLRFQTKTVDGATFDGATLAGRPAVLWFWAAWCPRCRAAAPDVAAVQREYAGRVAVVGVAGLGSGQDAMRRFVADRGIGGFPNLADDQGVVWRRFGVTTQEYYVILDARGGVVHKGALSIQDLRRRIAGLAG